MRLLLAGASGLIGRALAQSLVGDGHEVRRLVRRAPEDSTETQWSPERAEIDDSSLYGIDAVICLSGAGVGDHRWTESYRATIRNSRLESVIALSEAIARTPVRPPALLTASAVGYYGDAGNVELDENSTNGAGFLARLCLDWEAAAKPARDAGVRVVNLRTGLVLAPKAGVVGRMRPLISLGLGGPLGSGAQYWPWISLIDEVAAIRFLLTADDISGPVNLTGPAPVTNREFTATMARLLHRPAKLAVPGFALRLALGGFAGEVLASQRVLPVKLTAAGFRFEHCDAESALRYALAG